jgi:uncharacterized protein YajQ (UPF0234 family)
MKTFKQLREELDEALIDRDVMHSIMSKPKAVVNVAKNIAKGGVKATTGVINTAARGISKSATNLSRRVKQQTRDAAARQSNVPLEPLEK